MALAFDAQSSLDFTTSNSFTHTPVGTPKAAVVLIAQQGSNDVITAVTYGGTAMTRATNGFVADAVGDTGAAYAYFLGSSIPTGAQTVAITSSGGTDKTAWCLTLTGSADTQVATSNTTSGDGANPSVTLATTAGFSGFCVGVLFSGLPNPASITAGSGYTLFTSQRDYGGDSSVAEYGSKSGANVAVDFTATSDDVALVAAAIEEIAAAGSRPDRMMLMGVS